MEDNYLYPQLRLPKNEAEVVIKSCSAYPLHWHDFFEIEIITAGRGFNILNGKEYPIEAGSAYLLKPTDYHEIRVEEELEIYHLSFGADMLSENLLLSVLHSEGRKNKRLEGETLRAALLCTELIQSELERGGEYLRQLLDYMVHFFVSDKGGRLKPEQLTGINRALVYLEFHFREPIRLSALAREAGFNPTYFSEIFKQTTGETYIEKLTNLRLEYACTLLANNHSVSYACFESGFGSLSNFFTAFKKKYGISPREYGKNRA